MRDISKVMAKLGLKEKSDRVRINRRNSEDVLWLSMLGAVRIDMDNSGNNIAIKVEK